MMKTVNIPAEHGVESLRPLILFDVVTQKQVLIAYEELSIRDHRMCPRGRTTAIRLVKPAALEQPSSRRLDQDDRPLLAAQIESPVCHRQRTFGRLAIAPQDLSGLKVETGEKAPFIAAVGAKQTAIDDDHAAVVVLHIAGKIDFGRVDPTTGVFAQLDCSAPGPVGRSGEYQAILEDGSRTVNPHGIGCSIVPPQEFAIGRVQPDECTGNQLHILSLSFKVDHDHRCISGP